MLSQGLVTLSGQPGRGQRPEGASSQRELPTPPLAGLQFGPADIPATSILRLVRPCYDVRRFSIPTDAAAFD